MEMEVEKDLRKLSQKSPLVWLLVDSVPVVAVLVVVGLASAILKLEGGCQRKQSTDTVDAWITDQVSKWQKCHK